MALVTRQERASAIGIGLASLVILPVPGAPDGPARRQQLAACYAGITARPSIRYDWIALAHERLLAPTCVNEDLRPD